MFEVAVLGEVYGGMSFRVTFGKATTQYECSSRASTRKFQGHSIIVLEL